MTLSINGKTYEAGELVAYVNKLEQENTELKTKKIPQLERRIASIRGSHSVDAKKLNARTEQVERLKKENAELRCECRRCIHTDCPCVLSDYGKDRNGICDHFKDVFDENAELKNNDKVYCEGNGETLVVNVSFDSFTRINANHKMYYPHNSVKELQKENAELKEKLEHRNCLDCSNHDSNIKLAKAKKIIKEFMKYEITEYDGSLEIHFEELKKQAEQFLSEVEK